MAEKRNDDTTMTIRDIRIAGRRMLGESAIAAVRDTPVLDTDCLLQYVLQKDRSWLLAHDDVVLTDNQLERMRDLMHRRLTGLPIAYLTQEKEFYGYTFYVTPAVLIPKPDTEILIERAVELITARLAKRDRELTPYVTVVDMCTGSGCIAISVLLQLYECFGTETLQSRLKVYATDISPDALAVAQENGRRLLPPELSGCLQFVQGDLWQALESGRCETSDPSTGSGILRCESGGLRCDFLLTNPPYVPTDVTTGLLTDGRSEPRLALDGGDDGLDLVRRIIPEAGAFMAEDGVMLLETGEYNAEDAARLAEEAGCTGVHIHKDLAGMLRLTEATFPG